MPSSNSVKVIHYSPDDPVVQGKKVVLASEYKRLQAELSGSKNLRSELMNTSATQKAAIAALELEIAGLRARGTVFDTDASLDERLKAADMLTVAEVMAGSPIDAFLRHAAVRDLDTFTQWLIMRREESVKLHSRLVLEGREKDEIFDWVLSHSAAFGEALVNFKAAMAGIKCEPRSSESSAGGGLRTH